jgi:RND superfamily putative drug exporter
MRPRWVVPAAAVVTWLVIGGPLASLQGQVSSAQRNDNAAFLPASAESTRVLNVDATFQQGATTPAILVYARASGLTPADREKITADTRAIVAAVGSRLSGPPIGPIVAPDDKAAQVILPFAGSVAGSDVDTLRDTVEDIRARITSSPGLDAHVTGPVGIFADFTGAFAGIDGVLLLVTGLLILLILLVVYRSPILPLLVLLVAGFALSVAGGVVYLLARADIVTLSGQSQGILDVLVLGAATDYALLIVARFREELRRYADPYDAMRTAWRATVEPIAASGATVILALLCLLVSDLASNRGLGPIGAIGIACALLAMLTLLPALLVLFGRAVFWPFRPEYGSGSARELAERPSGLADRPSIRERRRGIWARMAGLVGRRARVVWTSTLLVLLILTYGLTRLEAHEIPQSEAFSTVVDSQVGQDVLAQHFPAGTGNPVEIIANAARLNEVVAAASAVPGVASVGPYSGRPVPSGPAMVVDGLVRVDATLAVRADSPEAAHVVGQLRKAVHAVPGAEAIVGGFTAINVDVQRTSQRDRAVIIPLVLLVVFVVLALLLRALLAPLLLLLTVLLSFFATLGVSGVVFQDGFGFPGADSAFPLFAFVFLVALGADYNIFLMTRVREEVARRGHKAGTLAALAVTGGVITSAGVVLAATFSALSVLPLVFLVEISFTVAFGVLLETLVVRSLLVPSLVVDIGRRVWWPSALRRARP